MSDLRTLLESPLREILAFAVGLVIGSFANVVIHRLPRGESIVTPRSRCPRCGAPIRSFDNVPVLSWLVLRARCRACGQPISARYPAVELTNGLLYLAAAWRYGATAAALVAMAFATALLVLSLIDLDHQILPNVITLPGIVAGLAASLRPGGPGLLASALSALGGYLAFLLVAEAYRHTRGREGLGQGDWKMAAMLGAFLGWQPLLLTILLATIAGTVVGLSLIALRGRTAEQPLPLGTFLGFAGLVVLFVGEPVLQWYRRLFGLP